MTHELLPLPKPFSERVCKLLENYPTRDGNLIQLFHVFANSERFLRKGTVNLLDRRSPIPMRVREIVILRVTANNNCEYEWGVHVTAFGGHVGLTDEQIRATRLESSSADCWSEDESVLIQVVDELCETGRLEAATKARFQTRWTAEQQLEILALCGNYHTVSFVANVSAIAGEDFGAVFPTA